MKIKLCSPKKSDIVIFDNERSDVLQRTVLGDLDHSVIHARFECYHIAPSILLRMLKNLGKIDFLKGDGITLKRKVRFLAGQLYKIYLLSCIEHIRPKIVLTFIDNSYWFQAISRIYKKCEFYAIQNGIRSKYNMTERLPVPPHPASTISMPNLVCFGIYETELYKKYNHMVDKFHPVGPLIGGYYKSELAKENPVMEFDICLVSQWHDGIMSGQEYQEIKRGLVILDEYLSKYVSETQISLSIALRSGDSRERQYFYGIYGDRATIIENDRKVMSTYAVMDQSATIVAFDSTAAREAFGWGKKVLFCNFSGDDNYDSPREGIWFISEKNYEKFREKLDYIRQVDEGQYQAEIKEYQRYLMNYNFELPAHVYIRNLVVDCINK